MKKIILLVLMSLTTNPTLADQTDLDKAHGVSIFDKIRSLYESGTLPDLNTVTNRIASGRCFTISQPNDPTATYLTATKTTTDVGPIVAPVEKFSAVLQRYSNLAPSYYDADSILITDTNIATWRLPVNIQDSRTYVLNYETKEAVFFRKSGPYIVGLANDANGNLIFACYYFKIH